MSTSNSAHHASNIFLMLTEWSIPDCMNVIFVNARMNVSPIFIDIENEINI
jgi:hypothetical protein